MSDKFTKKYVKELLSKGFSCGGLSITSFYSFDYDRKYDKTSIIDIDCYYSKDSSSLSLKAAKKLRDFLSDLIEYYEINDSNPTRLSFEQKRDLLIEKIKEDDTNEIALLSLSDLSEDKLNKILKHLKLI